MSEKLSVETMIQWNICTRIVFFASFSVRNVVSHFFYYVLLVMSNSRCRPRFARSKYISDGKFGYNTFVTTNLKNSEKSKWFGQEHTQHINALSANTNNNAKITENCIVSSEKNMQEVKNPNAWDEQKAITIKLEMVLEKLYSVQD